MKRPKPFDLRPAKGPTLHATPIRPPGPRSPGWYWRVVVYEAGAERTIWTGRGSPEEVNAQLWQLVGRGEHVHRAEPEPDAVEIQTVADLLGYWRGHLRDERADLAPATVAAYTSHSRVLEEVIGAVLVEQLGRRDLDRYRGIVARPPGEGSRRRTARASATLHQDMIAMGAAWAWGRSVGACPDRDLDVPTVQIKPLRDTYTPTDGEVAAVLRRLSGWARDALELQWATGARRGELYTLTLQDVDLQRGDLHLGRHTGASKTGTRRVPVTKHMRPLLARLVAGAQPDGRLWSLTPDSMKSAINELIREACEAEKIPVWTTHGLRRAYINTAARRGVDVAALATLTGHSVQVLMDHYRQVNEDDRLAAATAMDRELPMGEVVDLASRRR